MVEVLTSVLMITVLSYSEYLAETDYPFEETRYQQISQGISKFSESLMHEIYDDMKKNQFIWINIDEDDFYWFLNKENKMEIYFFKDKKHRQLIKTLAFKNNFKIIKYQYIDRSELKIHINGKLKKEYVYYKNIGKIISY